MTPLLRTVAPDTVVAPLLLRAAVVQRAVGHDTGSSASHAGATAAQGSVVGDGEIEPEELQDAADEALGLAQGEMEDKPEHQDELDR